MKLRELYNINSDVEIKDIKITSTEVKEGDLFVCVMGVGVDRHNYIDDAISRGAVACVIGHDVGEKSVPLVMVEDTNYELPRLCQRFYDNPQDKLKIIGVTGTDGKTSTSIMMQTLLGNDICGYIGTNGVSCSKFSLETVNTTPDADKLYKYMDMFVKAGCKYLVMEASSEAFFRGRLQNLEFDRGIFTNLTSDHINIHKTFDNYKESKEMLFKQVKNNGYSILNSDDKYFLDFKNVSNGDVITYGNDGIFQICDVKQLDNSLEIKYKYKNDNYLVNLNLIGEYNAYNLAAALICSVSLGFEIDDLIKNICNIKIDGRGMLIETNSSYKILVDYAHTVNGVQNILNTADKLSDGRKIVVIGAAGGRDPYKRPDMGKVITTHPNSYAIFTMEDPRNEDPKDICNDLASLSDPSLYTIEVDRKKAIKLGVDMLGEGDILLILGKGNENYQVVLKEKIYINDIEEAKNAIKEKNERK